MKLIVGLGNPGKAYAGTRHNIGFISLNRFAKIHRLSFSQRAGFSQIAMGEVEGEPLILAKPLTYMNSSGKAVASLLGKWQLPLGELAVIHDDIDLPLGQLRIRSRGGSAGHKGIESIIASLGSQDFARFRVGIGHPEGDGISYVLTPFPREEGENLNQVIAMVAEALLCLVKEGIDRAMNRYNRDIVKESRDLV